MDKLLAGLTAAAAGGGGGGSPPDLSALQGLMGGAGGGSNNPLARMMPNMDELNSAMEAMVLNDARPPYVMGPGVSEIMLHETQRWPIVYPHYLDSERTHKRGRRVTRSLAVPNPFPEEVAEACSQLGLRWVLEDKCYPRDFLLRGRIRVELLHPTKLPVNANVPNKFVLLQKLAQQIPLTPTRRHREATKAAEQEAATAAAAAAAAAATTATNAPARPPSSRPAPKRGGKRKKRH
eukprot:Protomagalhaensia_sp_Gyna_25__402@NODE_118_length_5105_cov_114_513028_g92_i0_p4_GENE_NODE_118_length_5105_cov_114_513028_g92_i0NODE_118_length_5105_cov_114_513028_g92_i0_p4_ORF_typecomplete_len236_score43_40SRP19/PF01922_17/1_1e04SRP19/PF01922_17/5e25BAF1_ABF1/PF04684_13/0_016_NODE_118_length_5105_cov_114_513028_g92_i025243231